MQFRGTDDIEDALSLLASTMEARGLAPCELVVVGGAAFNLAGVVIRPTKDVDVIALREGGSDDVPVLVKHKPLPEPIASAAVFVAEALGLDPEWLNGGPADLLDSGLPAGFEARLTIRYYGTHLAVLTPSRQDLICLKVYAAADTGIGRHTEDLDALRPTGQELLDGARWTRTQDPSAGFRSMLVALLRYHGCDHEAEVLERED